MLPSLKTKINRYYREFIVELIEKQEKIRNISVISNLGHGKSTLMNKLICRYCIMEAEDYTEICEVKDSAIALLYEYFSDDLYIYESFLINLMNTPEHIELSSEITSALRCTDGTLIIIDYIKGISVHIETILRQSLQELNKPVIFINKIDKAIFEFKHDPETIYQNLLQIIEKTNAIISIYMNKEVMGNLEVYPDLGNVAFGCALGGWGFTINTFAKMYSKKLKIEKNKLIKRLWGNNFFNPKQKKWSEEPENDNVKRSFCAFILEPLIKLANTVLLGKKEVYQPLLNKLNIQLNIQLKGEELKFQGKYLMNTVMRKWIEVSDILLEMIVLHIPSPRASQKYKTSYLYQGSMEDDCAKAMMNCDPDGPFMMFVSKMNPISDKGRFYAFGRVFSGKVRKGQKIRILGPNYKPGKQDDLYIKTIEKVFFIEELDEVSCGKICSLVGIDEVNLKQCTISTSEQAHVIEVIKNPVSLIIKVAVNAKNPGDLPKLVSDLIILSKADPLVQVINTETEHIIYGSEELHLEMCLKNLVKDYAK